MSNIPLMLTGNNLYCGGLICVCTLFNRTSLAARTAGRSGCIPVSRPTCNILEIDSDHMLLVLSPSVPTNAPYPSARHTMREPVSDRVGVVLDLAHEAHTTKVFDRVYNAS